MSVVELPFSHYGHLAGILAEALDRRRVTLTVELSPDKIPQTERMLEDIARAATMSGLAHTPRLYAFARDAYRDAFRTEPSDEQMRTLALNALGVIRRPQASYSNDQLIRLTNFFATLSETYEHETHAERRRADDN